MFINSWLGIHNISISACTKLAVCSYKLAKVSEGVDQVSSTN